MYTNFFMGSKVLTTFSVNNFVIDVNPLIRQYISSAAKCNTSAPPDTSPVYFLMPPHSGSITLKYDPRGLRKNWVRRPFHAKC